MRLLIRHSTSYAYDPPADRCALRLKLYPSAFQTQKTQTWSVSVNGHEVPPLLTTGFGDRQAIWSSISRAERVEIVAEGEVETEDAAGFVRGLKDMARPGVFLRETPLTAADGKIQALASSAPGATMLQKMHALCGAVRDAIDYTTGSTETRTTAAQALKQGSGVCQDHAHVFISAARFLQAPARYVVGYLLAANAEQTETHAWAEAYVAELGWIGFDPANRLCPTERYVRLASGLDSADAAPIRGNVSGQGSERLEASVAISQSQFQGQSLGQSQGQHQQ